MCRKRRMAAMMKGAAIEHSNQQRMNHPSQKPDWIKLGEVITLAADRAGIGESKLKAMLREDADSAAPQVTTRVFVGCTRKRYGRASVMRFLQISET